MENNKLQTTNVLPSQNEEIKTALTVSKIGVALPYEIAGSVSASIDKAIFFLGLNTHENDRNLIKVQVIEDVKKYFQMLTVKEIEIAVDKGVRGEYGDVRGISPKDIFNWITAYSKSQQRLLNQAEISKEETVKPTDEEIAQMAWNNLKNAWEFYKLNGYYNDFGNAVYKTLLVNDKINFSKEQKEDFARIATVNLENEYNPLKHVGNPIKMSEVKSILNDIRIDPKMVRIQAEARKIALNTWFKELVEIDGEIDDLFE